MYINLFSRAWWGYVFARPAYRSDCGWVVVIWCRIKGHPGGVVFYNPNGYEPDMTCNTCGDDLG